MCPTPSGSSRLQSFQRLALAFLVTAEYQSPFGRVEVQPDYIPEFLLKLLVRGYLEHPGKVGLQIVCPPYPMNAVRRDTNFLGHGSYTPARSPLRWLRYASDNIAYHLIGNTGWTPPAGFILQALQTVAFEPLGPLVDAGNAYVEFSGNTDLPLPFSPQQKLFVPWLICIRLDNYSAHLSNELRVVSILFRRNGHSIFSTLHFRSLPDPQEFRSTYYARRRILQTPVLVLRRVRLDKFRTEGRCAEGSWFRSYSVQRRIAQATLPQLSARRVQLSSSGSSDHATVNIFPSHSAASGSPHFANPWPPSSGKQVRRYSFNRSMTNARFS